MTNTREIIIRLKEVREEKGLSFGDILSLMEANGDFLSKSTLSRVFAEGSEENSFKYEETIRPIANAMLDIETIEEEDTTDDVPTIGDVTINFGGGSGGRQKCHRGQCGRQPCLSCVCGRHPGGDPGSFHRADDGGSGRTDG